MQYQREINLKLSKFKLDSTVDYYAVFEADSGATDKELKEQYRKLILKYHPDKNPHCKHCFKKFNEVMEAW